MGQYHYLINLDRQEIVSPHALGHGAKQVEHTSCVASLSDVLYLLLASSPGRGGGDLEFDPELEKEFTAFGRWVGDRVCVFGDYAEGEDFPFLYPINSAALHRKVDAFEDISVRLIPAFELAFDVRIDSKDQAFGRGICPGKSWT